MWRNLVSYRHYIFQGAIKDLEVRYAGTVLGVLWHIVHPVMMVLVLALVLGALLPKRADMGGEADVALFLAAGLMPWVAFADSISRGTTALVDNAMFLRKISLPEEVFVSKAVLASGLYLLLVLLALFAFCAMRGRPYFLAWLVAITIGGLALVMSFGIALALATLNVFVRDTGQIVPVVLQISLWLLPILYPVEVAPAALQAIGPWLPYYPFLSTSRQLMLAGELPGLVDWIWMIAWALGSVAVGSMVLRRLRPGVRDVL